MGLFDGAGKPGGFVDKANQWMTPDRALAMQGIGMGLSQLAAGQPVNLSPAYAALAERQQAAKQREMLESSGILSRFTPEQQAVLAQMPPAAAQQVIAQAVFASEPQRETVVVNGRLVDKRTGDLVADYSDPVAPPQRRIVSGADGYQYYEDTGERVLPGVDAPQSGTLARMIGPDDPSRAQFGLPDDGQTYEVTIDRATMLPKDFSVPGSGGTQVNVGGGEGYAEPPKDMVWATDDDGNFITEEVDLGGGQVVRRRVAVPISGTKADQTQQDIELKEINAINSADLMLNTIDGMLGHPSLDSSTGILAWTQAIPGSPMYDFGTRVEQLQGQVFLQAFESLKGGGQITEVEGQKAEAAMARVRSGLSPEDFREAVSELRKIAEAAKLRAKKRGSKSSNSLSNEELLEMYR